MNIKLNQLDRRQIIQLAAERDYHKRQASLLTNAQIAVKFDVHPSTIKSVLRRARGN